MRSLISVFPLSSLAALCAAVATDGAVAQCQPAWLASGSIPGTDGELVAATEWDPDGAGPATSRVVLGGRFFYAGAMAIAGVVAYDPATGSLAPIGNCIVGRVTALLGLPGGQLLVGGDFTSIGTTAASYVALWNGSGWQALGAGLSSPFPGLQDMVADLLRLPNGDIVVTGAFTHAGGIPCGGIARWDGVAWSPLGSGLGGAQFSTPRGWSIARHGSGDLYVGGKFASAGGVACDNLARWNGSSWSAVPGVDPLGWVAAVAIDGNGDLAASANFLPIAGGPFQIGTWDGTAWTPIGTAVFPGPLERAANGDLIAFDTNYFVSLVRRWNGTSWSSLGGSISMSGGLPSGTPAGLLGATNGDLYALGLSGGLPNGAIRNVARWSAATGAFAPLQPGSTPITARATEVAELANGSLVVAGLFETAGGAVGDRIVQGTAAGWQPLGSGVGADIDALLPLPSGELIVGGSFTTPFLGVARWDGAAWQALGSGINGSVRAMVRRPNGNVVVGGVFTSAGGVPATNIAEWNGSAWQALGTLPGSLTLPDAGVEALAFLPNGDLVAGGRFPPTWSFGQGGVLARWNGTVWNFMADALDQYFSPRVLHLLTLPNGDLLAAGRFYSIDGQPARGLGRFDGTSWSDYSGQITYFSNMINGLALTPAGDPLVASITLMRRTGATWTTVAGAPLPGPGNYIHALATTSVGVAIGGDFNTVNGQPSPYFAQLVTPCPASTTVVPTTCIGPLGPMVLTVSPGAWLGSVMRSTSTGYTTFSEGLALFSLSNPGLPLSQFEPLALPGCLLMAGTDLVFPIAPNAGVGEVDLPIPLVPVLAGLPLFHQHVQLSLDALGATVSMSSSNGLLLVLGLF